MKLKYGNHELCPHRFELREKSGCQISSHNCQECNFFMSVDANEKSIICNYGEQA